MREINAIIAAYDQAKSEGLNCVLATVVHVEGSSYRKAGARMLVDENGLMTGAISGGCLEGDALKKALHALHQQQNKLITYDTSDEDDAIIGAQLGCNGVIQVLFEPIQEDDPTNPIILLQQVVASGQNQAIVSLFNLDKSKVQIGTTLTVNEYSKPSGKNLDPALQQAILEEAKVVFQSAQSHFVAFQQGAESWNAFMEYFTPAPKLVLVGAGNDAQILAQMAAPLGWDITVADGRSTHANFRRFVSSCQIVVGKPETLLNNLPTDEKTYYVLMSHNYNYDLAVLKQLLLKEKVPYIGLLGPKSKFERMLADLKAEQITLTNEQRSRIFTPVGLNIGAETPAEIALSILAEIQSVITLSKPVSLRDKNGPIHDKKHPGFKIVQL